jgi:hypothetical protein
MQIILKDIFRKRAGYKGIFKPDPEQDENGSRIAILVLDSTPGGGTVPDLNNPQRPQRPHGFATKS